MARAKGMLNLSGNIEVLAGAPFDAREVVPTKADLTTASNFPYPYIGMETYVTAENKKYRYIGGDITQEAAWEELGEGGGGGGSYTAGDGIDITEEVISVDEMAQEDMEEIVTPKPSVMSRRFKYSTDEQIVGEWIDGKPIYQKTVDCGTLPNKTSKTVAHGISNIDYIVSIEGTGLNGTSHNTLPLPYLSGSGSEQDVTGVYVGTTNIYLVTNFNATAITKSYVTLQYTKTA